MREDPYAPIAADASCSSLSDDDTASEETGTVSCMTDQEMAIAGPLPDGASNSPVSREVPEGRRRQRGLARVAGGRNCVGRPSRTSRIRKVCGPCE